MRNHTKRSNVKAGVLSLTIALLLLGSAVPMVISSSADDCEACGDNGSTSNRDQNDIEMLPPIQGVYISCASSIKDQADPNGACILANTTPTVGMLYPLSEFFCISSEGNVGIGTINPAFPLEIQCDEELYGPWVVIEGGAEVYSNVALRLFDRGIADNNRNILEFAHSKDDDRTPTPLARIYSRSKGEYSSDGAHLVLESTSDNNEDWNANQLVLTNTGLVGIGTNTPSNKLDVNGNIRTNKLYDRDNTNYYVDPSGTSKFQTINLGGISYSSWPSGEDSDWTISGDDMYADVAGNVGIGTSSPDAKVTIQGTATQSILLKGYNYLGEEVVEIGEGFDYAETFPISDSEISPGTVVVIDPDNIGSLTVSTTAYDKKVAGIVSGARNLSYGMRLGTYDKQGQPVALSGRVYCNVDTGYGAIEPGDLLTTSPTPGYAMVVNDHAKATGAILGKAMEGCSGGGTGQILVLVTLQ